MRYYFIKDRVESSKVVIKHYSAAETLADHFTKLLQGTLFGKFRSVIIDILYDLDIGDMGMDRAGTQKGVM